MAPKTAAGEKTFSAETMKGLLASLIKRGVTIGNADFVIMAKLDANVTASSLEHQFRALKKQATEIAKTLDDDTTPAKAPRTPKTTTPGTGKKRGTKAAEAQDDDGAEETPSKKAKKDKPVKKDKVVKKENTVMPEPDMGEQIVEDGTDTNVYGGTSFFEDAIMA